jgi:hypothetical protein
MQMADVHFLVLKQAQEPDAVRVGNGSVQFRHGFEDTVKFSAFHKISGVESYTLIV